MREGKKKKPNQVGDFLFTNASFIISVSLYVSTEKIAIDNAAAPPPIRVSFSISGGLISL